MRRFLISLAALAYLVATTTAQASFILNSFISFPPASGTPAFSYRNTYTDVTNASSYTFTAADIGTANALRLVIVGVNTQSSDPTAITIAGVSATKIVETSTGVSRSEIWAAAVPTGTTGDIVVTAASAVNCIVHVWAGYPASTTAVDSLGTLGSSPTSFTLTDLAKTNGGFTVMMDMAGSLTVTRSFTQNGAETIIENFDGVQESSRTSGAASHINTATTTLDDYTVTYSATPSGGDFVAASWGP